MRNQQKRRKPVQVPLKDLMGVIDHKDPDLLYQFITESGRILPNRNTGVSAKCQRLLTLAIKRARFLALLPYCDHIK